MQKTKRQTIDPASLSKCEPDQVMAFVHIEKTAGTSVLTMLRNSFGIRHMEVRTFENDPLGVFATRNFRIVTFVSPWIRSICSHRIIDPTNNLPSRVRPYTILREPVSRAISQFQDAQRRGKNPPSLEEYLNDPMQRNFQVRKIAGAEDLQKAKQLLREEYFFVGLKERFDESMRVFAELSPWPVELRYTPSIVFADNSIRDAVLADEEVMVKLREMNELDAELYAWVADELYPAFLAKAGGVSDAPLPVMSSARKTRKYLLSRLWQRSAYRYARKLVRLFN